MESVPRRRMELMVRICVPLKWGQEEPIKAKRRFKGVRGQYIGQ